MKTVYKSEPKILQFDSMILMSIILSYIVRLVGIKYISLHNKMH